MVAIGNLGRWIRNLVIPTRRRARALLFADIVSSTQLYEEQGDEAAARLVNKRIEQLATIVKEHRGRVVKNLGDGILCDFQEFGRAYTAALAMSRSPKHGLSIRIGVHVGRVVEEHGDIFGDAVNTAARIVSVAKPDEVLVSKAFLEGLPRHAERLVTPLQPVNVKGKQEPMQLFALHLFGGGDNTAGTQTALITTPSRPIRRVLDLGWLGHSVRVDLENPNVSIGRQDDNGLVVDRDYVSRRHAVVYLRGGKLVLADQSSNGTYLLPDGAGKLHLRRDETMLHGSGQIFLGIDPEKANGESVRYRTHG